MYSIKYNNEVHYFYTTWQYNLFILKNKINKPLKGVKHV
jgi:hypothetical protein